MQAHFLGHGHFGEPEIRDLLATFSEGAVTVDLVGGAIVINIEDLGDFNLGDFFGIIEQRKPAHLGLKSILTMYTDTTQYFAAVSTHAEHQEHTVKGLEGMHQYAAIASLQYEYQQHTIGGI